MCNLMLILTGLCVCTSMGHFRFSAFTVRSKNYYRRTKVLGRVFILRLACTVVVKCYWIYARHLCYQELKRFHEGDFSYIF
jgi:hypothetical protein